MRFAVEFDPLLAWPVIAVLAVPAVAVICHGGFGGARGWPFRLAASLCIFAALLNPSLLSETREYEPDAVLLLTDRTSSQSIGERTRTTDRALARIRDRIGAFGNVEVIEAVAEDAPEGVDAGTLLMTALNREVANARGDRIAGAILLTDGRIADGDLRTPTRFPVHAIITGRRDRFDRELVLGDPPAFGVVGETVSVEVHLVENGRANRESEPALMAVSWNGSAPTYHAIDAQFPTVLDLELETAGPNQLHVELPPLPGELTDANNSAALTVNGVRDTLRVLLVSGVPHPGQRSWRNILKSDSSVDLIHFTILRSSDNEDAATSEELALIPFPVQELFVERIDEFDLIIFDRYRVRGHLPTAFFEFIRSYVERGGALLIAAGPEFAGQDSLGNTALGEIIPAEATGAVFEIGYRPRITETGFRHPVTEPLPDGGTPDGEPGWGRWFRQIGFASPRGDVLMTGVDERPLLVLDRVGEGRIALLASDQGWLWQRGVEGGGPQGEMLRRVAHWLMKEPDLEEEALDIEYGANGARISRRTLGEGERAFLISTPEGETRELPAEQTAPGRYSALLADPSSGFYGIRDGEVSAIASIGALAPREYENPLATDELIAPAVEASGGGVFWHEDGIPELRRIGSGRPRHGRGWLGLERRNAFRSTSISAAPLLPALLVAALSVLLLSLAWYREGR